jgi:uncharacterized protein (TIGR00730 family)
MRICVFGSSSNKTPSKYLEVSQQLGEIIAEAGYLCVNGGGAYGCMGSLNTGVVTKGGKTLGVIHDMFTVEEEDKRVHTMLVCKGDTLSERKKMLVDNCDCIIVLPGGVGTLDELWEATCNRSLRLGGMERIPICVLNINGYFDGSLRQLERAGADGLLYHNIDHYFHIENSAADAVKWCENSVANLPEAVESSRAVGQRDKTIDVISMLLPYAIGAAIGCMVTIGSIIKFR